MSAKKAYFAMLGLICLLTVLTVAGLVGGNTMLKKKSAELVELKLQDRLIEEQQTALVQANKDIEKYQELEAISRAIVPQDKDQARTVREIISLAEQSKIKINSISFPQSNLGAAQSSAPATSTNGGTGTSKTQTSPITQATPVEGIKGLYQLAITIEVNQVAPTYNQLIDFLRRLEQNRRTAQVTSIAINPEGENRNFVKFQIVMNVFIKP